MKLVGRNREAAPSRAVKSLALAAESSWSAARCVHVMLLASADSTWYCGISPVITAVRTVPCAAAKAIRCKVHVQMRASVTSGISEVVHHEAGLARYAAAYTHLHPYHVLTAADLAHWLTVSPADRFFVACDDGSDVGTGSFEPVPMLSDATVAYAIVRVDEQHERATQIADDLTTNVFSCARAGAKKRLMVPLTDDGTRLHAHRRRDPPPRRTRALPGREI